MKFINNRIKFFRLLLIGIILLLFQINFVLAQKLPTGVNINSNSITESDYYIRIEDVIYGRKYGTALTLDAIKPKKNPNGLGIIGIVSGGYYSSHESIGPDFYKALIDRGYTIFAVVHGSQPKYQVPEIFQDLKRSVRFIRYNAKTFGIDPDRIGVTGGSAGGNLSLLLGTAADDGNPKSRDPIDRMSCKVQAVACFFPPTDFLNWQGLKKLDILGVDKPFRPAFQYCEMNYELNIWQFATNEARIKELTKSISPIYFVDSSDAPTFIMHGNKDYLVPLEQSEAIISRFKEAGVDAKLVIKEGAGHGWKDMSKDMELFADWFDKYLKSKK